MWNWYQLQFKAYRYTGITLDLFIIIRQTVPEFNSYPNDRDLFRTLVAQISVLTRSYRYNPTATELPLITQLISVFIDTNCFTNNLSPFVAWTQSSIIYNDYSLQEELTVAPPKKDSTSQKLDDSQSQQTHQLRDGRSYTSSAQTVRRRNTSNILTSTERTSGRPSNTDTESEISQPQH